MKILEYFSIVYYRIFFEGYKLCCFMLLNLLMTYITCPGVLKKGFMMLLHGYIQDGANLTVRRDQSVHK